MAAIRLIARLDIKQNKLIKGIHLEGWRTVGNPYEYIHKYYLEGIDEIIYIDVVASLYSRDMLIDIVEKTTEEVFIPLTVGGGVRTIDDAYQLLRAGADKVAINSGALKNPELINNVAKKFGRQCMVLSVEAKKIKEGKWKAWYDCARESSGKDVFDWIKEAVERGAGEILITSIDQEGTGKGFDLNLIREVCSIVDVPVIASGGLGIPEDFVQVVKEAGANAVAVADAFHFGKLNISQLKETALQNGLEIRIA